MIENPTHRLFFGVLLFVVTAAFIWLIRGFLQPIFWAVALGIVIYPLHIKIRARLAKRDSLTASISLLLVILVLILPLAGIAAAVTTEATALYERLRNEDIGVTSTMLWLEGQLPFIASTLESAGIDPARLQAQLSESAAEIGRFIASQALAIGQNTIFVAVSFFLMLYLLFFFLRDGDKILEHIIHALPLGDERERHLLDRFAEVSRATIKGTMVVGVVQGILGGIMFAILGFSAPVLWGVVMAILSILPAVGPAIIWLPAAIMLLAGGRIVAGISLIVVGTLIIGLVDNLLRPLLVGRDTRMPDYLILLSTLGGLTAFGLAGIVIGPIIAAFFLSTWKMAEEEYSKEGKEGVRS